MTGIVQDLGIGATTAIFSVVYGGLLKPLPYADPSGIVAIVEVTTKGTWNRLADPNFDGFRDQGRSFEAIAKYGAYIASVSGGSQPSRSMVAHVSPEFFKVFRVQPIAGPDLTAADNTKGATPVAFVTYGYWKQYLGSSLDFSPLHLKSGQAIFFRNLIAQLKQIPGMRKVGATSGGVVEAVVMAPGIDPVAPLASEESMYVPATQMEGRQLGLLHIWFQPSWIVRTSGPVDGLTAQMQRALASADPNLPFSGFYRMRDLLAKTLATQRVEVAILSTMAALALLSTVGIFALVANIVVQKTREIGIRMALSSTIGQAMVNIRRAGNTSLGTGTHPGFDLMRWSIACNAQCALRSRRLCRARTPVSRFGACRCDAHCCHWATLRIARIDPAQTLRSE